MKAGSLHMLIFVMGSLLCLHRSTFAQSQKTQIKRPAPPVKVLNAIGMPLSVEQTAKAYQKDGTWRLGFTLNNASGLRLFKPELHVQLVDPIPEHDGGVGWDSDLEVPAQSSLEVEWDLKYKELRDVQMILTVKSVKGESGEWAVADDGFWDMFRPFATGEKFTYPVAEWRSSSPQKSVGAF